MRADQEEELRQGQVMNERVYHVMAAEKHLGMRPLSGGDQT